MKKIVSLFFLSTVLIFATACDRHSASETRALLEHHQNKGDNTAKGAGEAAHHSE